MLVRSVVFVAFLALAACRNDAPPAPVTLTSGAVEPTKATPPKETNAPQHAADQEQQQDDERDKALAERASSLVTFRNEQLRYRERIQAEITRVENVDEPRRVKLQKDLEMIDRATQSDWAPLRGELDRHLAEGAIRVQPRQVPR